MGKDKITLIHQTPHGSYHHHRDSYGAMGSVKFTPKGGGGRTRRLGLTEGAGQHRQAMRLVKKHVAKLATKSLGYTNTEDTDMSDTDTDLTKSLGDLFEEELGKSDDAPVLDCPHCGEGISKADVIAKAKGGLPGKARSSKDATAQNNASGKGANARYGNAPKPHVATKKAGKKVPKTDPAYPGAMAAKKSDAENDESVSTEDDMSDEAETTTDETVNKSTRPTIVGTAHVQYYTDPSPTGDGSIAKMIAEGAIGQEPTTPIDKNHKRIW